MFTGRSFARMLTLSLAALIPFVSLGCSNRQRYPRNMEYPVRQDLLFEKQPGADKDTLPPPGKLDQSLVAASKEPGAVTLDPMKLSRKMRQQIGEELKTVFGTPALPTVNHDELSDALDALKLDERTLRSGSDHYRRHCMHCHGVAGDGRGPTAAWVNPHPRDYRAGKFKFVSTGTPGSGGIKPSRADLGRTLRKGIEGTSMPAFALLPEGEIDDLVSYIIHLSLRGQVEFQLMSELIKAEDKGEADKIDIAEKVLSLTKTYVNQWNNASKLPANKPPVDYPADLAANDNPNKNPALKKSIEKGWKIFTDSKLPCSTCHRDYGRQSYYKYDDWGTLVRPANLTVGTYRGGRRIIDLYWRVSGGIAASGMPASAPAPNTPLSKGEDYWDLVNFIRFLPYPNMLPDNVRQAVYGPSLPPQKKKSVAKK